MESAYPAKKRKKFYQADFLERPALRFAALLFLAFQAVKLIRLFSDAIAYRKAYQVVPEDFTMAAVTGAVIMIALAAWLFTILLRQQRGLCVIRRGNRFLLLDLLLVVYGLVRAVHQLILFFQNFEILFLLDVLAIAGGLIAPALILFLADRQRIPPGDVLLLIIGLGTMGFSVLGFVMVAISIGKDYTVPHALPELAFRLGLLLAGLAAFRTALKLRAELPIDIPLPKAKPVKQKPPKKSRGLHLKFLDNLPGYDDEEPEISLFDDEPDEPAYEDEAPEPDYDHVGEARDYAPEPPAPAPKRAPTPTPVSVDGRATCLGCGRRFPAYLGVCPYCGRDMDAYDEPEPLYEEPVRAPEPPPAPKPPLPVTARRPAGEGRLSCPHCGKRFPAYLGVCPRCGSDTADM